MQEPLHANQGLNIPCCICNVNEIELFEQNISMHRFPISKRIRQLWLDAVQAEKPDFYIQPESRICGRHFHPSDITVKRDAIPSINSYLPSLQIATKFVSCSLCQEMRKRGLSMSDQKLSGQMDVIFKIYSLRQVSLIKMIKDQFPGLHVGDTMNICSRHFLESDIITKDDMTAVKMHDVPKFNFSYVTNDLKSVFLVPKTEPVEPENPENRILDSIYAESLTRPVRAARRLAFKSTKTKKRRLSVSKLQERVATRNSQVKTIKSKPSKSEDQKEITDPASPDGEDVENKCQQLVTPAFEKVKRMYKKKPKVESWLKKAPVYKVATSTVCEICGKFYDSVRQLGQHMHYHRNKLPTQCPKCGIQVSSDNVLKRHDKTVHQKLRPHKCSQCGAAYSKIGDLKYHIASKHTKGEATLECHMCYAKFNHPLVLREHLNMHKYGRIKGQPQDLESRQRKGKTKNNREGESLSEEDQMSIQ